MKINTGQAWADATKMIGANRELVLVLAGVFFFVPFMVLLLMLFGANLDFGGPDSEPNPELIAQKINAVLLTNWWAILLMSLGQLAGSIALISLLADKAKPTVGEAMALIPKLILTLIAVQILTTLATQALPLMASALPVITRGVINILVLPVTVFLWVKLSLAPAVIVIEKQYNPLTAMARSWELTKGNALQIFLFYLLILIAVFVVGLITAITLGLVLTLIGDRVQLIGTAIVMSALIAVYYALSYAVVAALYRQLSGPSGDSLTDTFD